MATNTFDRHLEIRDMESLRKLMDVINSETPADPLSRHPYTDAEKDRSEQLLKQCLSRSKRL